MGKAKGAAARPATASKTSFAPLAEDTLRTYAPVVDKDLEEFSASRKAVGSLYDFMRYHLGYLDRADGKFVPFGGDRGKRFRPVVCVLCHEALGGTMERALPAATAIELIHNFSLIHDDIMDGDALRRGRPTVWKLWGNAHAINAGDGMHALASLSVLRLSERGIPPQKAADALRVFTETILALCEGQYLDMEFEANPEVGVAAYLDMAGRKTASLIACAAEVGALLATDERKVVAGFRNFGWEVGVAFQIRDDVLGLARPENLGKQISTDILRGKKTFPILHALEHSTDRGLVKKFRAKRITEADIPRFTEAVVAAKSVEFAQAESDRLLASSLEHLRSACPDTIARRRLEGLANYLVRRER